VLTIRKSLEQTAAGLRVKRPKNSKARTCRLPQSAITVVWIYVDWHFGPD